MDAFSKLLTRVVINKGLAGERWGFGGKGRGAAPPGGNQSEAALSNVNTPNVTHNPVVWGLGRDLQVEGPVIWLLG